MIKDFNKKIYVAGHQGMAGSAIVRLLKAKGYKNIVTRTHADLDLTNQLEVGKFFNFEKPDYVYLAAGRVGGIGANHNFPAEFIYTNVMIEANVIHQAFEHNVKKILFLGSSCIYPKLAQQPLDESELLSGPLESTNEPYAVAKIVGIKLCESYNRQYGHSHGVDYRSIMPTNLYGPGDRYDSENSHVIPALIKKLHDAKIRNLQEVQIWGTGTPRREFLYVEDMAEAAIFVMNLDKEVYDQYTMPMQSHINVGYGSDITIAELVDAVAKVVGCQAKICFDPSRFDGPPRKLMNSSRLRGLGWHPKVGLDEGLRIAYLDFKSREAAS